MVYCILSKVLAFSSNCIIIDMWTAPSSKHVLTRVVLDMRIHEKDRASSCRIATTLDSLPKSFLLNKPQGCKIAWTKSLFYSKHARTWSCSLIVSSHCALTYLDSDKLLRHMCSSNPGGGKGSRDHSLSTRDLTGSVLT